MHTKLENKKIIILFCISSLQTFPAHAPSCYMSWTNGRFEWYIFEKQHMKNWFQISTKSEHF